MARSCTCTLIEAVKRFNVHKLCMKDVKYLFFFSFFQLSADLSKPVDKKLYKGTNPSCHDFNEAVAMSDGAPLLVGFTTGQIQLVQPGKREAGRLFNEEVRHLLNNIQHPVFY